MNKNKGFTIIELIVVIAIIAVLATIVLINVTQYINKGKDAAIKGNMATILTNSAIWIDDSDNSGSYAGFDESSGYTAPAAAIDNANEDPVPKVTTDAFCVTALLHDETTYCIDSTGSKGTLTSGSCDGAADAHGFICN